MSNKKEGRKTRVSMDGGEEDEQCSAHLAKGTHYAKCTDLLAEAKPEERGPSYQNHPQKTHGNYYRKRPAQQRVFVLELQ